MIVRNQFVPRIFLENYNNTIIEITYIKYYFMRRSKIILISWKMSLTP